MIVLVCVVHDSCDDYDGTRIGGGSKNDDGIVDHVNTCRWDGFKSS